ncbi:MAG TPA: AraC family transcriptional regulator [Sphingobacteriaceae bacterium]|nr:AraC family transcriptional regulator [Sphingobacteriaceae bacterium]
MKSIQKGLPKEFDKSFTVYQEIGQFFPYPWHYHPEYELVLVRKSTGRRMVGDNIGFFEEGDLVFLGPMLPHVWVNDEQFLNGTAECSADAVVIHFDEKFLGKEFMQIPEMEPFKKFLYLSKRGISIKGEARDTINKLMEDIIDKRGLKRLSILLDIFDTLSINTEYEFLASPSLIQNLPFETSEHLKKINGYILNNFQEDISLVDISNVANMALTTCCNFFKKHYRLTFKEYLNTVRIGHACNLLSEKDINIREISYACGYNNMANFNKQFKKLKHMSPREYRKKLDLQ